MIQEEREIVVILGQQGQGKSCWTKHKTSDLSRLCVWDPKRSYPVEFPLDLSEYWESVAQGAERFRVGGFYPEQAELVGSIAFAEQNCALVVEECGILFDPRCDLPDWARECVYIGRERKISVYAVAQRPRSINIALRSQATRIITFRQREWKDLDWLQDCFDPNDILNLPRLTCLDFDVNTQELSRYSITPPGKPVAEPQPDPSEAP